MLRQARAKIRPRELTFFGPTSGFFQNVNEQNPPRWIGLFNKRSILLVAPNRTRGTTVLAQRKVWKAKNAKLGHKYFS
jgi:hypothetical protein